MTEDQRFIIIDAAMQVGFTPANDDATKFTCTRAQLVDMVERARKEGQKDREPISMVHEIRAGPMRLEAARYNPTGNITFSMIYNNDLIAWMGQAGAELFAGFVRDSLSLDKNEGARELLRETAQLLRFYERNHRAKVEKLSDETLIADTLGKAERNARQAQKIEDFLKSN